MGGFADHTEYWTPERIENDWAGYTASKKDMLLRLFVHLRQEERVYYRQLHDA